MNTKDMIIIGLVLVLLISLYWNYQQKEYKQNIAKVRQDFLKLRSLVNEWNVFKGHKEIKELVEQMRTNPVLEEKIK